MNLPKRFCLNGQNYCINQKVSLLDLINYFNYKDSLLVLEYNKLICDKSHWKDVFISDLDQIEIVTIVGGG